MDTTHPTRKNCTDSESTPRFVKHDETGRYVRCTRFVIDETDQGHVCGGRQRPHPTIDGKRRYVCPDCDASTTQAYPSRDPGLARDWPGAAETAAVGGPVRDGNGGGR